MITIASRNMWKLLIHILVTFVTKKFTKNNFLELHLQVFHAKDTTFGRMIPPLISIDFIYDSCNFVENNQINDEDEEEEEIECPFDEEEYEQIDANYECFTQTLFEPQVQIEETQT
eukprot:GFUD01135331.1.p2 GENE.GFUD01135331.1~~GFUD01135331.1.p2  ORF type:complete len:116 (-),score=24.31 GFUD01135331.1:8-355(-)